MAVVCEKAMIQKRAMAGLEIIRAERQRKANGACQPVLTGSKKKVEPIRSKRF